MTETLEAAAASAPPEKKKQAAEGTEYLILSRVADTPRWEEGGTVKARAANAAIRTYLNGLDPPDGTYVAVPARSWQPVKVATEQKVQLRFS